MGTLYLTWLADELRAAGVKVVEMDGWKTRARGSGGYGSAPLCVMWHHTASPPSWHGQKDADYCTYQDSNSPLANIIVGGDTAWIAAAGATNTNGKGVSLQFSRGTVPADSMNSYAVGIEIGNDGVGESWSQATIDTVFKISNAINKRLGNQPTDVSTHTNYAVGRKIDPATAAAVQGPWRPNSINSSGSWNVDDLKAECQRRATVTPPTPEPEPPGDDDVKWSKLEIVEAGAIFMGWSDGFVFPQAEWVNGADPLQMARYENYDQFGWGHELLLSYTDCKGILLIGPVPTGDDKFAQHGLTWDRKMFGNVIP